MVELWRLARNRYARTVYEGLAAAGITVTLLTEYVASLDAAFQPPETPRSPDRYSATSGGTSSGRSGGRSTQ